MPVQYDRVMTAPYNQSTNGSSVLHQVWRQKEAPVWILSRSTAFGSVLFQTWQMPMVWDIALSQSFKPNQLIPTTRVGMLNTVPSRCACLIDLTETLSVHRRSVYRSWENQGQIWQMYPKNCISQMRLNADVGYFKYFSRSDRRF